MDLPATMQAVRFHEHGDASVLRYEEAPVRSAAPTTR